MGKQPVYGKKKKNARRSLNRFSEQRSTHGETYACVKNISELSAWRRFRKANFCFSVRGFPEDNESSCHRTHRKFALDLAASAALHMAFPINGASTAMTQPQSMLPIRISVFLFVCLCLRLSVTVTCQRCSAR